MDSKEIENQLLQKVTKILNNNSIYFEKIGITQKEKFTLDHEFEISIRQLLKYNNSWFKKYVN